MPDTPPLPFAKSALQPETDIPPAGIDFKAGLQALHTLVNHTRIQIKMPEAQDQRNANDCLGVTVELLCERLLPYITPHGDFLQAHDYEYCEWGNSVGDWADGRRYNGVEENWLPHCRKFFSDFPEVLNALDVIDQILYEEIEWVSYVQQSASPQEVAAIKEAILRASSHKDSEKTVIYHSSHPEAAQARPTQKHSATAVKKLEFGN